MHEGGEAENYVSSRDLYEILKDKQCQLAKCETSLETRQMELNDVNVQITLLQELQAQGQDTN